MRRPASAVVLALLPIVLAGALDMRVAHAQDPSQVPEDGVAPPGCWTMRDGCPAGTGSVSTPGLRAPFREAWSFEPPASAAIEGTPRVWRDLVFLATGSGTSQRTLHVLGLADGRALAEPVTIETSLPLDPCVWDEVVVIREAQDVLGAYRLGADGLARIHEVRGRRALHAPLFHERRIYAIDGSAVCCWQLGTAAPVWRREGNFRGSLALRGRTLYALSVDEAGNINIDPMDRDTGGRLMGEFLGHWQQEGVPPEGVIASIVVLHRNVLVQHTRELATAGEGTARTSWLHRVPGDELPGALLQNGLLHYEQTPVAAGEGWLAREPEEDRSIVLKLNQTDAKERDKTRGWTLATPKQRPAFAGWRGAMTVAGDVAYVGGRAFEWRTREVVWDGRSPLVERPVPAHDTLLVLPSTRRLMALREQGAALGSALFVGRARVVGMPDATVPVAVEGAALFADGSRHEGAYEIGPDGRSLVLLSKRGRRAKRQDVPMGKVRLLLDAEDRLVYVSLPALLDTFLTRYHFLRLRKDYVALAKDAYRTYDPVLMKRLIDEAASRGASARDLKHPRKQQDGLATRPRKHDEKRRARVLAKEQNLASESATRIEKTIASALEDPRWAVQMAFARRVLATNPSQEQATTLIRERLPDFIPAPDPFRAAEWIDLVDALQRTPVTRVQPPEGESRDLTRKEREFGAALHAWRKDLVGLESGEMMILTPLTNPGRIGGCLSMGDLVCRALEEVFGSGEAIRTEPYPLIMHLYETEKEYLEASTRGPGRRAVEERERLRKTAGHYDPEAGITRLHMPVVADAWQSIMATYAHELTHHWIEERCPLFESREGRLGDRGPGYWIVEGMADFLKEFRWDLRRRHWDARNPRARSLDVVANASPEQLIPWKRLYQMSAVGFFRLARDDERLVPMRWRLGSRHSLTEWSMFYAQAAATTHYLYHAGEAERASLLGFVAAYYTGKVPTKGDPIQACIGVSADELGRRVTRWAREQNALRDAP